MTGGHLTLIHGNALSLPLADRSVHLIVSSPPYWKARDYRDGGVSVDGQLGDESNPHLFLTNLWAVLDDCWRVLRDDGSCWINLGDKFSGAGPQNAPGRLPSTGNSKHWGQVSPAVNGVRSKSRMLLPHRFALGLIDPEYRQWTEERAGLTYTSRPPQWICRMDAVWSKANGLPESVTDRVRVSHEYWFHLTKSERYYAAMDEVREPSEQRSGMTWDQRKERGDAMRQGEQSGTFGEGMGYNPLGKLPGSVWEVATEPLTLPPHLPQHFAAFPSWFPRRLIAGWSPSGVCTVCGEGRRPVCDTRQVKSPVHGDGSIMGNRSGGPDERGWDGLPRFNMQRTITGYACACPTPTAPTTSARVLDPFSGTGTTAIVAAAVGRHGIGVDLSWDYHRIARWRDTDGGLRAKALGVDRPAREVDGQMSLLGEAG